MHGSTLTPVTARPNIWNTVKSSAHRSKIWVVEKKNRIVETIQKKWTSTIGSNTLWQKGIKPFYERDIKHLTKKDLAIMVGAAVVAAAIVAIAYSTIGIAAVPLSIVLGLGIFLGSCGIAHYRVRQVHNETAWDHLDGMRREVYNTKPGQELGSFQTHLNKLSSPEFKHLDEQVKDLKQKTIEFQAATGRKYYNYKEKIDVITAHLTYLKTLVQQNNPDAAQAADQLIETIKNVTPQNQQEAKISQKIGNLKTTLPNPSINITHNLNDLDNEIKKLQKALQGPSHEVFETTKAQFIDYIQTWQSKLSNKPLEELKPSLPQPPLVGNPPPQNQGELPLNQDQLREEHGLTE